MWSNLRGLIQRSGLLRHLTVQRRLVRSSKALDGISVDGSSGVFVMIAELTKKLSFAIEYTPALKDKHTADALKSMGLEPKAYNIREQSAFFKN